MGQLYRLYGTLLSGSIISQNKRGIPMNFIKQFWAPREQFAPVGMFSAGHVVLLMISLCILLILLRNSRGFGDRQILKITKISAIVMTILELIKIVYSFSMGYFWINAWMPIAFCSIFIYALWLSGYGSERWKSYGDSFLCGAAIVGGATYLIFPSTSLMIYPIWHYQCLYSMFFHTLMIYVGILYLRSFEFEFTWHYYSCFSKFYMVFAAIAIVLNTAFESNLMLLRAPFHIPVPWLHSMWEKAPWGYTLFVFGVYLVGPYWGTCGIYKLIKGRKVQQVEMTEA